MTDNLNSIQRSLNMSRIQSKNTKPEMIIRSILYRNGFRFRLHKNDLPGKPDIVLKKYSTVIFCNGCFWHQHYGCKRAVMPKSNRDYWMPKLKWNIDRFKTIKKDLKNKGWKIIVIWECEIKDIKKLNSKLLLLLSS